jgi:Protein of unknown function (DUF3551)
MRTILTALVLTILMLEPQPGRAEITHPWCGQYARDGRNCGFSTYDQCRAAIGGNGGYCIENPMYQPTAEGGFSTRRPRR